jgi:hypothetical protein
VNFDSARGNALFNEEAVDLLSLVALELNDLAHLLVINKGAIAGEILRSVVSIYVSVIVDSTIPS